MVNYWQSFSGLRQSPTDFPTTEGSEILNGPQSYPSKNYRAQLLLSGHYLLNIQPVDHHNHHSSQGLFTICQAFVNKYQSSYKLKRLVSQPLDPILQLRKLEFKKVKYLSLYHSEWHGRGCNPDLSNPYIVHSTTLPSSMKVSC